MRFIKILTLTLSTVLLLGATAFAKPWSIENGNWNDFTKHNQSYNSYLSKHADVGGFWDVSFIYKEAANTDVWTALTGQTLSNKGTIGDTVNGVSLLGSEFLDTSRTGNSPFGLDTGSVKVFRAKKDFTAGSFSFLAGDLLIAFNDAGGDSDYDDFILKATPSATPIPGAAWLLGTGLVGLIGIRRKARP